MPARHPGEIALMPQQIRDELHVHMRHPAAVFGGRADLGEDLARLQLLAKGQAADRSHGEVAVEGEKAAALVVVAQDDRGAVVEHAGVVVGVPHAGAQGRVQGCAHGRPNVHAQVHAARGQAAREEGAFEVKAALFEVAAVERRGARVAEAGGHAGFQSFEMVELVALAARTIGAEVDGSEGAAPEGGAEQGEGGGEVHASRFLAVGRFLMVWRNSTTNCHIFS